MSKRFQAVLFSHSSSSSKEINFSAFHIFVFSFLVFSVIASVTAFGVVVVSEYLYSYRLDLLRQEKSDINKELVGLNTTITDLQSRLSSLYDKDNELRTMVALEPVDPSVREIGTGGSTDIPSNQSEFFFTEQELLTDLNPLLERLNMQIALQEESFSSIQDGIEQHKEWLRFYPGGYPVEGGRIKSVFGRRQNPWNESEYEDHWGLDIGGLPVGTPIHATADGRVVKAERNIRNSKDGLGFYVKLEHMSEKYGWITKYGHLSKIDDSIREGVLIKRGDVIGYLGNTGRSNAPHLHYEINYYDARSGRITKIDPRLAHMNPSAYR